MSVVSLSQWREERQPRWEGTCVCLACRHEWQATGPMGTHTDLECPSCLLPKGVTKYLFGAAIGDALFACTCGCEAMTVYRRASDRRFITRCMACGADQTAAIYGDTR